MARVNNQDGIVFDALSAGPIEGLVNGSKSVYLNGAPFTKLAAVNQDETGGLAFKGSAIQGNDFIDVINSKVLPLANVDFAVNDYYIWIEGAGKLITSSDTTKTADTPIEQNTT